MALQIDTAELMRQLSDDQRLPPRHTAVFVGGSYARGWANQSSDIDLYVVSLKPWQTPESIMAPVALDSPSISMELWEWGAIRFDIEYWLEDQVDELISKVSLEAFDTFNAVTAKMTGEELYLLERLLTATVINGAEWVRVRCDRIHGSAYQRVLLARAFNNADNFAEDAVGQLRNGDLDSATLSARLAFQYAVDGLLISNGEYGRSPKWRARRFRTIGATPQLTFDEYWAIETMRDYDPANPQRWISDVVRMCRTIMTEVSVI